MKCVKCGYVEKKVFIGKSPFLCTVCKTFFPSDSKDQEVYLAEKLDHKILQTFRKSSHAIKVTKGMQKTVSKGKAVARPPKGYTFQKGILTPNEDASKIHSLFKTFLNRNYSLNSLAKNFSLSTNGLKKILTNRTYLGEIKFAGNLYKANHEPIISQEIFYAVQRKLQTYLRSKK